LAALRAVLGGGHGLPRQGLCRPQAQPGDRPAVRGPVRHHGARALLRVPDGQGTERRLRRPAAGLRGVRGGPAAARAAGAGARRGRLGRALVGRVRAGGEISARNTRSR
jgi:hypothetical protein